MNEAENLRRMAELWTGSDQVVIPGVIDASSSRRVLTMDYMAGYAVPVRNARRVQPSEGSSWHPPICRTETAHALRP